MAEKDAHQLQFRAVVSWYGILHLLCRIVMQYSIAQLSEISSLKIVDERIPNNVVMGIMGLYYYG